MTKTYIYILTFMMFLFVGCADEAPKPSPNPTSPVEAPTVHRDSVPLSFEASLGGEATRAEFKYESNSLKLSWSENDALGVYIKTEDGKILRAGSIYGTGDITNSGKTRKFKGHVLQKFEHEQYIYMHPNIGSNTYVNLEDMSGELNSTTHLNDHLPIVWRDGNTTGTYLGYVLHLTLNFNAINPGKLKKVTLLTDATSTTEDRIFPRHYNINSLVSNTSPFAFNTVTAGKDAPNTDYTHAITLNVVGNAQVQKTGDDYIADVYLASSEVQNMNIFSSKIKVQTINESNQLFSSLSQNFKGQTGSNADATKKEYLSSYLLQNGTMRKMTATMSAGNISPTIISTEYLVSSILGMWNEYGKPYDPNGLVFYKTGPSSYNAGMPDVLVENGNAIHDRYILTTSRTGTPIFTWKLYESQCTSSTDHAQDNVDCNNIFIDGAATDSTEIFVSFLSEYAWNQNLLGYYHYKTGSAPDDAQQVMKNIIFPNLSKPGHEPFNSLGQAKNNIGKNEDAPLEEYMTVKLVYTDPNTHQSTTKFPAGTTIGFWGIIDAQANGFQQSGYSLLRWGQWRFFSNSKWNGDTGTDGKPYNSGWTGNYARCNFFASGDICKTTDKDATTVNPGEIIQGIAIYGFKDDATNNAETAYSTCIFLVSAGTPSLMKTNNKACFNIGCTVGSGTNYPQNIVINKTNP